jgi:hypothetical protein
LDIQLQDCEGICLILVILDQSQNMVLFEPQLQTQPQVTIK